MRGVSLKHLLEHIHLPLGTNNETWYVVDPEFVENIKAGQEGELRVRNERLLYGKGVVLCCNAILNDTDQVTTDHPLKPCGYDLIKYTYPQHVWKHIIEEYSYDVPIPRSIKLNSDGKWDVELEPKKIRISYPPCVSTSDNNQKTVQIFVWAEEGLIPDWMKESVQQEDHEHTPRADELVNFFDIRIDLGEINGFDIWAESHCSIHRLKQAILKAMKIGNGNLSGRDIDKIMWIEKCADYSYGCVKKEVESPNYMPFSPWCESRVSDLGGQGAIEILVIMEGAKLHDMKIKRVVRSGEPQAAGVLEAPPSVLPESLLVTGGLCGLHNLGNTCFMNSALQCLAHTLPLTRYYLRGDYLKDLNRTNPVGMGGELAETYAAFLMDLWRASGSQPYVIPSALKHVIGRFAPNFQGYAQQDSQELLAFLLDGLHEDCNKVSQKPYVIAPEGDEDVGDETVADEAWKNHKLRNESVIVDLFQGQYRSRVECPHCGKVSKTFDPFMYCSLPLPQKKRLALHISLLLETDSEFSWPFTFPIEVWYRNETMPKDESPQTVMTNLLEAEGNQIRLKIAMVLFEAYRNSSKIRFNSTDTQILINFLKNNERFMSVLSKAKHAQSSGSGGKLVRALSSDGAAGNESQSEFSRLTISDLQFIIKAYEAQLSPDTLLDQPPQPTRDVSPSAMPPLQAVNEPLNLTGFSYLDVSYACADLPESYYDLDADNTHSEYSLARPQETCYIAAYLGTNKPRVLVDVTVPLADTLMRSLTVQLAFDPTGIHTLHDTTHAVATAVQQRLVNKLGAISPDSRESLATEEIEIIEVLCRPATDRDPAWYSVTDIGDVPLCDLLSLLYPDTPQPLWGRLSFRAQWGSGIKTLFGSGIDFQPQFPNADLWLSTSLKPLSEHLFPAIQTSLESPRNRLLRVGQRHRRTAYHTVFDLPAPEIPLSDCFQEFVATELLAEDNMWYCSRCKDHVKALKKMDFWRLPDILVVHLKRFSQSRRFHRTKLESLVTFPHTDEDVLDLKEFLLPGSPDIDNCKYRLFAVDRHFGTLGGGHYTAFVKCHVNSTPRWYLFDDNYVAKLSDRVQDSSAYILLYERMGSKFVNP
eukprot:Blabericola_migrator_1__5482@NODE_27_length_20109_cov_273_259006_g24_i0_p4_GENE_NODE_27_length_20109_cov_273_259006_g24_i0NODE_27_length_20109_cov_273_259006_g24_i0_p4_ORF_typecomplete_len1096_score217_03UCH/PF00443_29/1_7e101UCH_1/PF13423_6/2_2UCH_1/PF13423_6/6_3e05UCH_1/PF13423_6/2_4e08DUF2614/PF11023_8/2_3DUF2614/PF11023_8/3_9e02_NODE_27_length_20109_cov_273_259006_g24_i0958612873